MPHSISQPRGRVPHRHPFPTPAMIARDACVFEKAEPIFWSNDVWAGDPDGDITLSFEDEMWRVKKDIIITHFPWIMAAIARAEPVSRSKVYSHQ